MLDDPSLLVVDDEEVICEGCRRIFVRQGFQVEKSSDPRRGLDLAMERDYKAILLDIKMPALDGIQFLERLRSQKPDVPVILMTGYPSIPNAASAMRLGASDYVTKPFTPEEITQAVQRLLSEDRQPDEPAADPWTPAGSEVRFFDEAWFQPGSDGTVRAGAVLGRVEGTKVSDLHLPRVGEAVYQGLPMAGLVIGNAVRTVPAPVSGVVVAVNPLVKEAPSLLWHDPCGTGWIAAIAPTRLEQEAQRCRVRHVVLATGGGKAVDTQARRLASLGCRVELAGDSVLSVLRMADDVLVLVDGASLAEQGPELVRRINTLSPGTKVVVLAAPDGRHEGEYRQQKIFFYALEPFADGEIGEVLDAAFRPQPAPSARKATSDFLSSIAITNRNGQRVLLMAEVGLLRKDEGLGAHIRRGLLDRLFPLETSLGKGPITQVRIATAAKKYDHVVVVAAKDTGRLPGSLAFDTKGQYISVPDDRAGKVTTAAIQPDSVGAIELDDRTAAALAEHIVEKMAEY